MKITQDGLLSFAYSVSGGAYSYLIKDQSITASNGPLPASFRVGFAGSDGGATNIHEIMCFKAASANQSGSSATVNEKEAAKVEAGTQAYFAYYDPNDWTGTVTANNLIDTGGVVTVTTTANWDASCVLTGTAREPAAAADALRPRGPTSATPAPAGRIMLTWDTAANVGIPFEWASLNAAQQAALDFGDASTTSSTLELSARRSQQRDQLDWGRPVSRARRHLGRHRRLEPRLGGAAFLALHIDVDGPSLSDGGHGRRTPVRRPMCSSTRPSRQRLNVVYVGANDGFLHGFEPAASTSTAISSRRRDPNDGQGGARLHAGIDARERRVAVRRRRLHQQCEHGHRGARHSRRDAGRRRERRNAWDRSSTTRIRNTATISSWTRTPGSGDLFYGGQWHTWLVGGLGAGGAAIYALDVTDASNFTETGASSLVIGEWNAGSIACANVATCGNSLGNTFGTPLIRRLHDGNWAIIFGNGFGSPSGDAGIYIITINAETGGQTIYYLSTNTPGTGNGIAYVTSADLDGDHITDYLYAGDLLGNVWRFDLTSNTESHWAAAGAPLFTTQSGQPITSAVLAISSTVSGGAPQVLIELGTGERTQLTNLGPEQFVSGTQSLYGVWDWNMSQWNALAPSAAYSSLAASTAATGLTSPYTLNSSNLQAQTLTPNANGVTVDGTNVAICWQGSLTACGTGAFGWYANLPFASEQIIYNPVYYLGGFIVNSTIPANNVATSCTSNLDTGFTYVLNIANGGVFPGVFPAYGSDASAAGQQTNASGSPGVVTTSQGTTYLVSQGINGVPVPTRINPPSNTKAKRLTWVERR